MEPPKIDKSKLVFNLSHSSMETLEKCPYNFYLRYIRKFYPDGLEPNYSAEFGLVFHEASEEYTGSGREEFESLINKFKPKHAISPEYEVKFPLGIDNFMNYHETYIKNAKKVYKEKKLQILLNELIGFNGSIDILYQRADNKWVIVDLKSSKKPSNYSNQLSCYYYLLAMISGTVPKSVECQIVYLAAPTPDKVVQEYTLDFDDMTLCENRLLTSVNKISILGVEDPSKWVKRPGPLCPWCDYYKANACSGNDCSKMKQL